MKYVVIEISQYYKDGAVSINIQQKMACQWDQPWRGGELCSGVNRENAYGVLGSKSATKEAAVGTKGG